MVVVLAFPLASCQSSSRVEPAAVDDPEPDAIYTDFLGGKFDEAGHPVGAFVLQGAGCNAETGWVYDGRVIAEPWFDDAGVLCAGETDALGAGLFAVNVRAAVGTSSGDATLLRVRVLSTARTELAMREIAISEFDRAYAYQNFPVPLRVSASSAGPVRVELEWLGDQEMELEYIEVFRRDRQLVLEPLSGVLDTMESLRIEIVDPPSDAYVALRCGTFDRSDALQALLDSGAATVEDTEFRRIITAPIATLLEGCELPTRLVADLRRTDRVYTTSEIYLLGEPIACPEDDGRPLVILTGFLPFPAGSNNDNSSREAVLGFDAATVPEARVMQLELPVEFDTAAALVADLSARCDPAVVVGFGQGRYRVDLETTAYNSKDTSDVPGGVPDNRGVVLDGEPIRDAGDAELPSRLPIDAIYDELQMAGVNVGRSDDPGRYICNNLFYTLAHDAPAERIVGFVHLPIIRSVTESDRAMLQTVVQSVVRQSLAVP